VYIAFIASSSLAWIVARIGAEQDGPSRAELRVATRLLAEACFVEGMLTVGGCASCRKERLRILVEIRSKYRRLGNLSALKGTGSLSNGSTGS